jgi:anti-anti-sigma factor
MVTAPLLRSWITNQASHSTAMVLDMDQVTFLGCAGLTVLVETAKLARARGAALCISTGSHSVARPLAVLGLNTTLPVFPDAQAAVRSASTVASARPTGSAATA